MNVLSFNRVYAGGAARGDLSVGLRATKQAHRPLWKIDCPKLASSRYCCNGAGLAMLAGCTGYNKFGIDLRPGRASAEMQRLASLSSVGDKAAQLELGVRYEEGRGVAGNLARAKKLYQLAARDAGGPLYVYSPSPGNSSPSRVLRVERSLVPGLYAAAIRLEKLRSRE